MRLRGNAGVSVIEGLVVLGIIGFSTFGFFKTMQSSLSAVDKRERSDVAQRFESLLRGQIITTARDRLREFKATDNCDAWDGTGGDLMRSWHDLAPATGPKFSLRRQASPLDALLWINAMNTMGEPPEVDTPDRFAYETFRECAIAIIDYLNSGSRVLPTGCMYLMNHQNYKVRKEHDRYILGRVNAQLFDFSKQESIDCPEFKASNSRGIRVGYALVWNVGKGRENIPVAKSGVVEVIDGEH